MMINKDSLKARANNISNKMNIHQNIVYNRFFFDAFLARLAASSYMDRFILKGGLYLSSLLGVSSRSTMDIDFCIKQLSMEKEKLINILNEIIGINMKDGISFRIIDSKDIRMNDPYGGYQIKILGKLDNVKYEFGVDIATGDPIVPSEKSYDYKCLVTGNTLPIKVYSLESVIAEKIQTILARGIANSRSKDFYDLYILRKTQLDNVDINLLRKAFDETFKHRNFAISKQAALGLLDEIVDNEQVNVRWTSYIKSNKYATGLELKIVISTIKEWIE